MTGFSRGSRPVEFSGQITRSGVASWPALTSAASCTVAADMVLRDLGVVQLLRQVA